MMDNGMGTYKLLDDDDAVIAKGVVSPDGKLIVSRDPEPWEGMIAGDATNDTHYAGTDNAIVDLQRVNRSTDNSNTRWDLAIYDAEGNFKSFAIDVIAAYDKVDPAQRMMESKHYFGKDGYLTVFASDEEAATYAYIIEPGSLLVVFKTMLDDRFTKMGDSWDITSVNDGLIAYNHYDHDAGAYIAAGWMDINGKHVRSIDTDKYYNWWNYSCGMAQVANMTGLWFGYVDESGKEVVPCIYSTASMFKDGYAYVENEEGKYGYLDTAGKTAIPFEYDGAYGYGEGLFAVAADADGAVKYGLVNANNDVEVPFVYDDISYIKDGVAYAIQNGELVVLNFNAEYDGPTWVYPMNKDNSKTSEFELIPALRGVKVKGSQSESESVLIASYDEEGRFLGVKAVTEEEDTVRYSGKAASLLFLGTDKDFQPMAEAIEVDLSNLTEPLPPSDVFLQ